MPEKCKLKGRTGATLSEDTKLQISNSLKISYATSELKVLRDAAKAEQQSQWLEQRSLDLEQKDWTCSNCAF